MTSPKQRKKTTKTKAKKAEETMTVQMSLRLPKSLAAYIVNTAKQMQEDKTQLIVGTLEKHVRAYVRELATQKSNALAHLLQDPSANNPQ